jgi:hypothetical protein
MSHRTFRAGVVKKLASQSVGTSASTVSSPWYLWCSRWYLGGGTGVSRRARAVGQAVAAAGSLEQEAQRSGGSTTTHRLKEIAAGMPMGALATQMDRIRL